MGALKRRGGLAASLVAALLMAAPTLPGAIAQQGPGGGGGGDGSGELYSDLVVALRDVDGLPIMASFEVPAEEGVTTEYCVQPVVSEALPGMTEADAVVNPVDGRQVYKVPLVGDGDVIPAAEEEVEVCDPQPAYAMYVEEAELERLNMARTQDDVLDQKLADVMKRLLAADLVTLDPAGRLLIDGLVTDAGPEHAALFQSLMLTGKIPGLFDDPALLAQVDLFGSWELAAVSLGAAASKFVPVSIDAALYYNRVTGVAESEGWRAPALVHPNTGEAFVDYGAFSYTRSEVFKGCVTWLDVPDLTWHTSTVADAVGFAPLPPIAEGGTLHNAAAFAQLAEDVRATIFYLHENEVVAGFFMDPVGQNTCTEQEAALSAPAVSWAGVPTEIVQTETFPVSASAYNPHGGSTIDDARLRVTIDAKDPDVDFTVDDITRVSAVDQASTDAVPFALDPTTGNLVGEVGLPSGFLLEPGDQLTTTFDVKIGAGAPIGTYELTLDLLDVSAASVLATDVDSLSVLPAELTALWTSVPGYTDQDANAALTARVFNPETAETTDGAQLQLTLDAPEAFTAATEVTVYSAAVAVPLTLDVDGNLSGTTPLAQLAAGASTTVTWYVMVADGAPMGPYFVTVAAAGSAAAPDMEEMYVGPADTHGNPPDDPGEPGDDATINELFMTTTFAVNRTYVPLVGDFDGTSPANAQDIIWYAPGTASDAIWAMTATSNGVTASSRPLTVNGYYEPFTHDLDGNGVDDIVWYSPGTAPDYVWFGLGDFKFESKRLAVNRTYRPVATYAGGKPVIYWHAPGTAKDVLWVGATDRSISALTPIQVNGTYEPVPIVGTSGKPGILWYAPGPAQDWVWDGLALSAAAPATHGPVTIDGTFMVLPASPAALLYSPTGTDFLFGFELFGEAWTPLPGDLSGASVAASSYEMGTVVLHAPGPAADQVLSLIP